MMRRRKLRRYSTISYPGEVLLYNISNDSNGSKKINEFATCILNTNNKHLLLKIWANYNIIIIIIIISLYFRLMQLIHYMFHIFVA